MRCAIALAPRWRRRLPGAGGKGWVVVEVEVEGRDGEDSSCSLMVDLPPFVTRVREAVLPASSNSSNSLRNFWSSAFILNPESEFTTSHFNNFHLTEQLSLDSTTFTWLVWYQKKSLGIGFGKFGNGKNVSVSVSVKILVPSFSAYSALHWSTYPVPLLTSSPSCSLLMFVRVFCFECHNYEICRRRHSHPNIHTVSSPPSHPGHPIVVTAHQGKAGDSFSSEFLAQVCRVQSVLWSSASFFCARLSC